MLFKCLISIILLLKQFLPLLGNVYPPVIVNDKSFVNDPDSLSMFAKYEDWNPRVINGWKAKLGDVPYQISLKYLVNKPRKLYMTICGAAIIGPRKLLSAAHCFDENSISNCHNYLFPGKVRSSTLRLMYAVAGTLRNAAKYQSDGQWRKLEKVEFPKTYDFPKDDIAVIIPESQFYYNNHVGPIPIASRDADYEGKCLVSGYGRIGSHKNSDPSLVLLLGHLYVLPKRKCRVEDLSSEDFICTSTMYSDVGKGDSGGPLVCAETGDPNEKDKGILVGVVSGTIPGSLSLCTRISRYQSFIKSVNSVSMLVTKYNIESCTAITILLIYKTFVLL